MSRLFGTADILIPQVKNMEKWAVIACDQFTSDAEYWQRVAKNTKGYPSTANLILPECYLGREDEPERIAKIKDTMEEYLESGVFTEYPGSYVYVERTQENGSVRHGIVGAVDLEQYDYSRDSKSMIRATEATVEERIPPRMRVRKGAALELPHIIMLFDDFQDRIQKYIETIKPDLKQLYSFDLQEEGGHIAGWLVNGEYAKKIDSLFDEYCAETDSRYNGVEGEPFLLAVGDGNHSLATAKKCFEEMKAENPGKDFSNHPARRCLVELENIHDHSIVFEPIHRVIFDTEPARLLEKLKESCCAPDGYTIRWVSGESEGSLTLDRNKGELAVAILQEFLDGYLSENEGRIDYIHDDDALINLAKNDNAIGFLLPYMEKKQLFRGVMAYGALPRKTFSMGHSREKRYYIEGKKIK